MSLSHTFQFSEALSKNNSREWFNANKSEYDAADSEVKTFFGDLLQLMKSHDHIDEGKSRVYRIYRDVRFSNDKTPFKTNRSGSFTRATKELRGGYYFSIEPGASFVAGGFFGPSPQDLLHIRKQISSEPERLKSILSEASFIKTFGNLQGDQVKTAPKGFDKEDPAIELLRYKQFIIRHSFSDKEILSQDFAQKVNDTFRGMRPFLDYMSEILTTDLNGETLLKG
jgi:uncharacterized protein (TIGR02453 family)